MKLKKHLTKSNILGLSSMLWTAFTGYLILKKYVHAPGLKLIGYFLWGFYGVTRKDKFMIVANIIMIALFMWGWIEWMKG